MTDCLIDEIYPLPLKLEEVTPTWLTHALRIRYPGVTVLNMRMEPVNRANSTVMRLTLDYDEAGLNADLPPTLILKGGFEAHADTREWMVKLEVQFYSDVQPFVTLNSPKCYFAASEADSYQAIMLLEDLSARNVMFQHGSRPLNFDAMATLLRAIATYQAETWESPEFSSGGRWDWMQGRLSDFYLDFMDENMQEDKWASHMARPHAASVSIKLHDLQWARKAIRKLRDMEVKGPRCLNHGDPHLGNLYLDTHGNPGFFDPNVCSAHWSFDVCYALVGSLDVADRRNWERALLAIYLEELASRGVDVPSYDDAYNSYACGILYGYFQFIPTTEVDHPIAMFTRGTSRFGAAALDNDSIERLG
jgi:hypothetical protein